MGTDTHTQTDCWNPAAHAQRVKYNLEVKEKRTLFSKGECLCEHMVDNRYPKFNSRYYCETHSSGPYTCKREVPWAEVLCGSPSVHLSSH